MVKVKQKYWERRFYITSRSFAELVLSFFSSFFQVYLSWLFWLTLFFPKNSGHSMASVSTPSYYFNATGAAGPAGHNGLPNCVCLGQLPASRLNGSHMANVSVVSVNES